jgi:hypothetical protein
VSGTPSVDFRGEFPRRALPQDLDDATGQLKSDLRLFR